MTFEEAIPSLLLVRNDNLLSLFVIAFVVDFLLLWNNKILNGTKWMVLSNMARTNITRFAIYYLLVVFTHLDIVVLHALRESVINSVIVLEVLFQLKQFALLSNYEQLSEFIRRIFNKV